VRTTRRTVIQGMGAGLGLAACPPPAAPNAADRAAVRTIVICMMENRSFDHVFGSLSLVEGRTVDGLTDGMSNTTREGELVPITPLVEPCTDPDPPHSWDASRVAHDGGSNQGFVWAYQDEYGDLSPLQNPMTYQVRAQQPVSYALADDGALCDRWYSSVLTSTWPNRIYLHAGQSMGQTGNTLPPGGSFTCRTIWDQLLEVGVDWAYYFSDLPTLALFGRSTFTPYLLPIDLFYADAAAGGLPPVVCVDAAAAYNDDHPPHHPLLGQYFVASIYQALVDSPHRDEFLLIVTYDEAGGFFDHVPPPTIEDDRSAEGFGQLGFRVPAFAAGPFVQRAVSSTPFEHTAILKFVQDQHGIDERLTLRNEVAADLAELLDADRLAAGDPAPATALPVITTPEEDIATVCPTGFVRSGQPELQRFVRERAPHLDRSDAIPDLARRFWRRLGEQGLWVPAF